MVEEQLVVHDHVFVQSMELVNMYLIDQDNEHFDEAVLRDYFLEHGKNDTFWNGENSRSSNEHNRLMTNKLKNERVQTVVS
jgi:hypothetical protein